MVLAVTSPTSATGQEADQAEDAQPALTVERLAGMDRYETAVAIALHAFPDDASTVHLARADDPADALAGGVLTSGPVLLVPSCEHDVPTVVLDAVATLDPGTVVALGGTSAVCDDTLDAAAGDRDSARLAGDDRFATSAEIALAAFPDGAGTVYVAAAAAPVDALVAGALTDGPLLLAPTDGTTSTDTLRDAIEQLDPTTIVGIGGSAVLPDDVLAHLAGPDRDVERLAGDDRGATAAAVAMRAFPDGAEVVHLARSDDPADAVAGGALTHGPVLLVPNCAPIPQDVIGTVEQLGARQLTVLGGDRAVCDWALDHLVGDAPPVEPTEALTTSDVHLLAARLTMAESAIRAGESDPGWLASLARWQHAIYRRLTVAPELRAPVLDLLPEPLRAPANEQVTAAAELRSMVTNLKDAPPEHWRIVEPPPVPELMGYYLEAQEAFGVPWEFLAAINLVETRFGKIDGTSTAGAQGPMQFMPATWEAYGNGGDIKDHRDSILAAGRYLRANGAPSRMDNALFRYNRDVRYVRAVTRHAQLLAQDPDMLHGYHQWEVWYLTTGGDVLLPVGWDGRDQARDQ